MYIIKGDMFQLECTGSCYINHEPGKLYLFFEANLPSQFLLRGNVSQLLEAWFTVEGK